MTSIAGRLLWKTDDVIKTLRDPEGQVVNACAATKGSLQNLRAFAGTWGLWHRIGKWEVGQVAIPDPIPSFFNVEVASSAVPEKQVDNFVSVCSYRRK